MEAASNFCTDRQEGMCCCFEPVVNSPYNVSMHGVFFYYFVIDRRHKKYLYMNNNNSIILFYMNNISLHKSCFCVMLQNSLLLLFFFIQLCASSVQSCLLSAGFFVFFFHHSTPSSITEGYCTVLTRFLKNAAVMRNFLLMFLLDCLLAERKKCNRGNKDYGTAEPKVSELEDVYFRLLPYF